MSRESQDTGLPPAVAAVGRIEPNRDRWPELAGIAALALSSFHRPVLPGQVAI